MRELAVAGRRAADDQLALAAADPDVARDLLDGAGVDQRPDVDRSRRGRSRAGACAPALQALEQRLDDRPLDDDAARGRAALAGRPERRPEDPVGREVEVGVGHDDDRVLAAELQADPLELAGRPARRCARPVADEPVNEMTGTSGLSTIASPTSPPPPVTRLTVPAGKPASAISSTRSVAQWGVSLDGLKTTVLPATSAGIIFQHGIAIGKFQGVMIPATPIGWRMLIAHLSGSSRRDRVAEHPAALAGHQEGDVDPLLDVAPGLGDDLAHLAGHRPGEALLVLGHQRGERGT